ncbi:serine proteinase stubble-like [Tachypleus tridentatus]|uniref:serine proteinase stubble-like n=1 Tax=Tachypleus tridentatus TaxID=6853 RepID=UPI003FD341A3
MAGLARITVFFIITNFYLSSGLQIRPKPCSNDLGEKGTCMFVWDCIQTDGVHLNHCLDGILIGSCCGHNDVSNTVPDSVHRDKPSTGVSTPSTVTSSVVTKQASTSNINKYTFTTVTSSFTTTRPTTTTTRKPSTTTTTTTILSTTTPAPTSFQPTRRITRPGISNRRPVDPFKVKIISNFIIPSIHSLLLSQIRIRVGEYDFSSVLEPYPYIERGVKKKVVHPSYNFFTYENDLALVKLEEPVEFRPHIAPICLPPDDNNLIGRNATITGWGRLSEGGVLPSMLQEVQIPIVSNKKCKNMFLAAGRNEYLPNIFMCAGFEDGGRDSCQGDSGGPMQIQGDDGRWFLAGIISWGLGGEPNLPGVSTRISKFKDWILENIT